MIAPASSGAAILPELRRGYQAIRRYLETTPTLPEHPELLVLVATDDGAPTSEPTLQLISRGLVMLAALADGRDDIAAAIEREPPPNAIRILMLGPRGVHGPYQAGEVEWVTSAGNVSMNAFGGSA